MKPRLCQWVTVGFAGHRCAVCDRFVPIVELEFENVYICAGPPVTSAPGVHRLTGTWRAHRLRATESGVRCLDCGQSMPVSIEFDAFLSCPGPRPAPRPAPTWGRVVGAGIGAGGCTLGVLIGLNEYVAPAIPDPGWIVVLGAASLVLMWLLYDRPEDE